jgi:hypothetical protein
VNLSHLRLFHHFQTQTQQTLLFPSEFWEHSLQLCFQFEYLINAILCIAARHLACLQPDDITYPMVAVRHLSRSLSLFQHELSNNFPSMHIDAFIATSVLLQYEVWTNTDFCSSLEDGSVSFEPMKDRIFSLSSGLKQVFLKDLPIESGHPSILLEHAADDPRAKLLEAAQISSETRAQHQALFSSDKPLRLEHISVRLPYKRNTSQVSMSEGVNVMKCTAGSENVDVGYSYIVRELCLVLSFLPEAQPPSSPFAEKSLLEALVKYIFAFPVMCRGAFASLVERNDPHALLVLYHFYRAVGILLPRENCWWAHKRAELSEVVLKKWLIHHIEQTSNQNHIDLSC